jgi:hypothetical protein
MLIPARGSAAAFSWVEMFIVEPVMTKGTEEKQILVEATPGVPGQGIEWPQIVTTHCVPEGVIVILSVSMTENEPVESRGKGPEEGLMGVVPTRGWTPDCTCRAAAMEPLA